MTISTPITEQSPMKYNFRKKGKNVTLEESLIQPCRLRHNTPTLKDIYRPWYARLEKPTNVFQEVLEHYVRLYDTLIFKTKF